MKVNEAIEILSRKGKLEDASIYLNSEREMFETDSIRLFKTGIDDNCSILDITLAPGMKYSFLSDEDESQVIIPVIGNVDVKLTEFTEDQLEVEQIQIFRNNPENEISFTNPHPQDLNNFLVVSLTNGIRSRNTQKLQLGLSEFNNELVKFFSQQGGSHTSISSLSIGKFGGREEGVYRSSASTKKVVYSIDGAFEVHNRLLHARDTLYLNGAEEIEFEALSNDAVLLIIEFD